MSVKKLKCPCCLNESLYWALDASVVVDAYTSDDEGRPLVALGDFEGREIANYFDEGHSLSCSNAGCYFSIDESGTSGLESYEEYSEELLEEVLDVWDQSREIHTCDQELRAQEPHNFDVTVEVLFVAKAETDGLSAAELKRAFKRFAKVVENMPDDEVLEVFNIIRAEEVESETK